MTNSVFFSFLKVIKMMWEIDFFLKKVIKMSFSNTLNSNFQKLYMHVGALVRDS